MEIDLANHQTSFVVVGYAGGLCTRIVETLNKERAVELFKLDVARSNGLRTDEVEVNRVFKVGDAEELEL